MSDDPYQRRPWEPDPRRVGTNWTAMFDQQRSPQSGPTEQPPQQVGDDESIHDDSIVYRPWSLQRGQGRPALLLFLRRFDARSRQWFGWGMSYHSLYAVEHIGDRVLTLDFGLRQFVMEGRGLDELARRLNQGIVTGMLEYAASIWPEPPQGPVITTITQLSGKDHDTPS